MDTNGDVSREYWVLVNTAGGPNQLIMSSRWIFFYLRRLKKVSFIAWAAEKR